MKIQNLVEHMRTKEINISEAVQFDIIEVHAGWFEAQITNGHKTMELIASGYLGHDGPCDLLDALLELFKCKAHPECFEKWVVWDGEPCATIWNLKTDMNNIQISIYISSCESYDIDRSSIDISIDGDPDFEVETNLYDFINQIIRSFEELLKKITLSQYEKEWDMFPAKQLEELRTRILEANKSI